MAPSSGRLATALIPRPNDEERSKALADPGPPWSEWFYGEFLKIWIALGFFVLDAVLIVGPLLEAGLYVPILPALLVALYLEYLAFQYLWHEPREHYSGSTRAEAGLQRWVHPVTFGRWTRPGRRVRQGLSPYADVSMEPGIPDASEFL